MDNILLAKTGIVDLHSIKKYTAHGGYGALKKALSMPPENVASIVTESGLRGRGGAGFPAGMKWKFLPADRTKIRHLICNADEGEPGTFKDRQIMEFDPHLLIEGMTIAAYAIGALHGFIYIRGEYDWIAKVLVRAIKEAEDNGYSGTNILGSGFQFCIDVFRGAGSYICGEETSLMESIEGKAGRPRLKPPFPATAGLYCEPTVIHNVSTLAFIPFIIENGPDAFRAFGKPRSYGTNLFGICGHVNKPGIYEYPLGTQLRKLIYEVAGGVRDGKRLKAVIPGGLSAPILRADEIDVDMDFESLVSAGSIFGTGGIIVLDEDVSIPFVAQKTAKFYAHESCGQCTPCREGTNMIKFFIDRLVAGKGTSTDIDQILRLCRYIKGSTICALGDAAAMSLETMVKKFRGEFEALLKKEQP
ncbi:MAG: NADH-quinone oxidoreductase subunit NuoF [Nitrospirae bacterium]|nr:NADH-quinone oxidoreductase subunit NuoF [Nitrospirota bacterium]